MYTVPYIYLIYQLNQIQVAVGTFLWTREK